ncbi:hypothetical protein B2H97_16070 [Paraclostridium bifermentans]|uniref:helix-turn-helix domain-containing protein n=1 Tax=Paraclostridium bifermentans TaxID=1490 RepID=UPI000A16F8BB|nr:helix-turn-helix domain-containing protein [Paraclostridium bifermentans]OSB07984.1 hypothetical protein B2H97_16070 [Paraclostridium bifermentans]
MCSFKGLYSFAEATKLWGLKDSTLRKAVETGKLVADEDCKKFGRDWVVKETSMLREYGELKNNE